MLSLIVARAQNNVIGSNNNLPWYLPADLKHFKEVTLGKTVVMGRRTYESIVSRLGHGLPGRQNIVISRSSAADQSALFVSSLEAALDAATSDEIFVIGGAQIYEQALPFADKLYITEVDATIPGDVFFPELDSSAWQEIAREEHSKNERNPYNFAFVELIRRQSAP